MRYLTPALLAIAVTQGCASTPPAPDPDPVRYGIDRRASAAYQASALAGAAYTDEGYRHVLVYGTRGYSPARTRDNATSSAATGNTAVRSSRADESEAAERSEGDARARMLWEQYCDAGADMSDDELADLESLRLEHPMPADLADTCAPPK